MAKITRKHQKIFAGDVPVTNVVAEFGSLANGAAGYTGDPDGIQTARYEDGWASAVINNYAPCIQDFNALFYLITRQLAYLFQAGIPEWNTSTAYYIGSLVHDADGGIYMSVSDTNSGQALTTASKWTPILSKKITNIGDNYAVDNTDWLIIWSTANPNVDHATVTLPAPAATNSGREIIVKNTRSVFLSNVIIVASGGSTIDGAANQQLTSQYASKRFTSDGTNWHVS